MRIISFHACVTRGSIDHDDINVHLDAVNVRLSLIADLGVLLSVRYVPRADIVNVLYNSMVTCIANLACRF